MEANVCNSRGGANKGLGTFPKVRYVRYQPNEYGHGTTDWFQIGKGVRQGCILSPCLFNLYAEYIMRNTGLEETQAGLPGEISITSDMQMTPPLWQKVKRN